MKDPGSVCWIYFFTRAGQGEETMGVREGGRQEMLTAPNPDKACAYST